MTVWILCIKKNKNRISSTTEILLLVLGSGCDSLDGNTALLVPKGKTNIRLVIVYISFVK